MYGYSWGGSEELWARTALSLRSQGFSVSASVLNHTPLHPRIVDLNEHGVDVWTRLHRYSLARQPWRWFKARDIGPMVHDLARVVANKAPKLIVFSDGGPLPPVELLEYCFSQGLPFVTIGQANTETLWYTDRLAERYRRVLSKALACFFVSRANRELAEKQIGENLSNGDVVWNPVNIALDVCPAWSSFSDLGEVRFACVGRLHPPSKGQDILLEALAMPSWRKRSWRLSLYGDGPMKDCLRRMAANMGIGNRVELAGFASVENIWATNHVLVMPSRYEGLPLSMVEAMLCGRPVIATDVAGHAEIVEDGVTGFLANAPTPHAFNEALQRFWDVRYKSEEIGQAGSLRIRALMPSDPVHNFSEKLKRVAGLTS